MDYRLKTIRDGQEFDALCERWNELWSHSVDANIFMSHAWLSSWWNAYRPSASLQVVLAETGGKLVGIAPLMAAVERTAGWPVRKLRFIGDGTAETDHMNFIVTQERREQTLNVMLEAIAGLEWDVAHFNQMPEESANTRETLAFVRARRWLVDVSAAPSPLRHLPATYEDLLRTMPSRLRTSIRTSRRKIQENHKIEFGLHATLEELPSSLDSLFRNHAGRWQTKGEAGVFADPRKRDFYALLSPLLLASGALRFYYLKADGRIVAQQYCFEHRGTVMLLQEGFDPSFARENVGNVLRSMVFEHLIASGSHTYDFLAGVSRHKRSWSNSEPNDLRIGCARKTLSGSVAHFLPRGLSRLKRGLRYIASRRLKDPDAKADE